MRRTLSLLILATLVMGGYEARAAETESGAFDLKQGDTSVSISAGRRPLLEYRWAGVNYKPYVQKLFSPDGINILRDSPHDHVHHHALMFALIADGVDFWGESAKHKQGSQIHREMGLASKTASGAVSGATITEQLDWVSGDGNLVLQEERTIATYQGEGINASLLTWQSRLRPANGKPSVTLSGRHYLGLGMRLVESMDGSGRFLYACGEPGPIVRGTERFTPTKWCAYTAPAGGRTVTVAMFDHPANPRHPAGIFTMLKPFTYLSTTPNVWKKPLVVEADEPITLCWGVALWDGEVVAEDIQRMYQTWLDLARP